MPLLGEGDGVPRFEGVAEALAEPGSQVRLFGKPVCEGHRRLAVCVAAASSVDEARATAARMAAAITIELDPPS